MKISHLSIVIFFTLFWVVVASSHLTAGPPSHNTADAFNGRLWLLLSGAQKISHLTGIKEAF